MSNSSAPTTKPRWFVSADIDGFFGLALDNFIQILIIINLCQGVLGFSPELLYGRVLPGVALSLIVGNIYYAWLAYRESKRQNQILTALPYGINTISLFAYVFLIMLPVRLDAIANGSTPEMATNLAWQVGLVACLGSGLIELGGATVAKKLQDLAPRAALLSTLGGIALTFISLGFFLRTYAHPLVAFVPLGIILLTYYGGVKFRIPGLNSTLPGGLVAIVLGVILAWVTGLNRWDPDVWAQVTESVGIYLPHPWLGSLWAQRTAFLNYFSIILPMGLFNLIGSLQNLESAAAAGDRYPVAPSLAANGVGSVFAAIFGSCFPTTIYIGHPGWKAMGAEIGYSWLNGLVMGIFCLTGTFGLLNFLVPIDSGMAIVLWIGIVIVAQSFTAVPSRHTPAVVIGLLPGIAGWGILLIKTALRVAGFGTPQNPFSAELIPLFNNNDIFLKGGLALEQGLILSAMILSAMTVCIIERKFGQAAIWSLVAAALAWIGLLHAYIWTVGDTALDLGWGTGGSWAVSYLLLAIVLGYAQFTKHPEEI